MRSRRSAGDAGRRRPRHRGSRSLGNPARGWHRRLAHSSWYLTSNVASRRNQPQRPHATAPAGRERGPARTRQAAGRRRRWRDCHRSVERERTGPPDRAGRPKIRWRQMRETRTACSCSPAAVESVRRWQTPRRSLPRRIRFASRWQRKARGWGMDLRSDRRPASGFGWRVPTEPPPEAWRLGLRWAMERD